MAGTSLNLFDLRQASRLDQARHLVPIWFNDTPYDPVQFGVGDVAAVPGQQVLAAVNGGGRDVSSIVGRFARDRPFGDQVLGQFQYLATDRQYWNIGHRISFRIDLAEYHSEYRRHEMEPWVYHSLSDDAYIISSISPRVTFDKVPRMTVSYCALVQLPVRPKIGRAHV